MIHLLQIKKGFDWHALLLGEEEWSFLPEVLLRSAIMFIIALAALRLIGKRGIMQGVFEIVTIITLGSAAGDPMFYKKVGLLPAILVFVSIILMYRFINYLVAKYKHVEYLVEGRHVQLIRDKKFVIENFKPEELNKDEILSDLRMAGVKHLGQVDTAYIEASGRMSVFFLPDEKVDFGLPIFPELFENQLTEINTSGIYSCSFCGHTEKITPIKEHACTNCKRTKWVASLNEIRVK
jgi:uncharacterized membrane protein YcaP (DUF421 family)